MDIALILGIVLAFGALYAMINLEHASIEALLLPAPMILVFGATIAIGIASGTFADFLFAVRSLPRAFRGLAGPKTGALIDKIVGYADKARKEGLLALEAAVAEEKDPFLRQALQNIADGTDSDDLRIVMEDQAASLVARNRQGGKFFVLMGGYAPTIGIVGTVVSLTHVLEKLDEPDTLGPMIAAAFVATLWGLLSANFMWLPIGMRLQRLAELDHERMTLITEGMLAVQSGSTPTMVEERLRALTAETQKTKGKKDASGPRGAEVS